MSSHFTGRILKLRKNGIVSESNITEQEIVRGIRKGQYTGEEEFSTTPFTTWRKLSSHPPFYDVLVKTILDPRYTPPSESPATSEKSQVVGDSPQESTDRSLSKVIQPASEGKEIKTSQDPADPFKDAGTSIEQGLLDSLFDEQRTNREHTSQGSSRSHTSTPQKSFSIKLNQGLDFGSPLTEHDHPERVRMQKRRDRRRLILWSILLVGLLFLLFQAGNVDHKTLTIELSGSSDINESTFSSISKAEKMSEILLEEGDVLYSYDNSLFYRKALQTYNRATKLNEANLLILGRIVETASMLVLLGDKDNQLEPTINAIIKRGRVIEPHLSAFYRAEARLSLGRKKFDEAFQLVKNAKQADPNQPETELLLGEMLFSTGQFNEAKTSLESVVSLVPQNIRAQYYLALSNYQLGNHEGAFRKLKSILSSNPMHLQSLSMLGSVQIEKRLWGNAIGSYEECARNSAFGHPSLVSNCYQQLAKLQRLVGQPESAEKNLQLAEYFSRDQVTHTAKEDKEGQTQANYLQKLSDSSQYGKFHYISLAENLAKSEQFSHAELYFRAASYLDERDGAILVQLGDVHQRSATSYNDLKKAMLAYLLAIQRQPTLSVAYIKLGLLETDQYNFENGYNLLAQAIALSPDSAEPYLSLGKHFYKRKDYSEALKYAITAAKLRPTDAEILYTIGVIRLQFSNQTQREVLENFYRAYTLDPYRYDALVEWLKLLVGTAQKSYAVRFVRKLIEKDRSNARLYWALGEVHLAAQEYLRSIDYFHRALDLNNQLSLVRLSLGKAWEAVGNLSQAIAEFRTASLLDRRNGEGFFRAAELLAKTKKYKEAKDALDRLISYFPNYPGAYSQISKIYKEWQEKENALTSLQKEVTNNPMNSRFRLELAELYMGYERPEEAITELTQITNLPPTNQAPEYAYDKLKAYLLLSRCYRNVSKFESAEGAVRLALLLDPDDPILHKELAYVFLGLQRDKEAAKEFQYYLDRTPAAQDVETIKQIIQQIAIEE